MKQKPSFFFCAALASSLLLTATPTGAQEQPVKVDTLPSSERVFEKVEIEASINAMDWRHHLEKQLQPYLDNAVRRGMKPGQYTVNVRFLVERDGRISDVKALNDPGFGLAQGAVRTVRTGPRWSPGELNGRKVRSYHTQPITFMISEQ